jgi:DNA-binding NarL/FixJ family response regulator
MQPVRVLVVGAASRRAESLCVLLRALHDVDRVGQAENPTTAWQAIAEFRPTVVLVDVGLPGAQGLALLERVAAERPCIGRIALAGTDAQAQAACAAGATTVVRVPTTLDRLANGLRDTHAHCEAAT